MPPKDRGRGKLPVPLPKDMILKDTEGKSWRLGSQIGQGGFGLIYLASPQTPVPVEDDAVHVIKVEYLENGPLFSELKFYQRAAKQEQIRKWMDLKKIRCLGIPVFWGSGLAEYKGRSYRFMVMERLGEDLQRIFEGCGRRFKKETVLQLGARMLDTLEYIHENEYVHGDIKAANLLLGYTNPHEVYLADYGLSYRYCPNGNHKQYQENPRKGHNGTIEFTSIDAHKGVAPSRRGDLEILGYCMLQWLCGKLPWEQDLKDPVAVKMAKTKLMDELPGSVTGWDSSGGSCSEIAQFLVCVYGLAYDEKPKYPVLKKILLRGLESSGIHYDGPLEFCAAAGTQNHRTAAKASKQVPRKPIVSTIYVLRKAEQKFMFNKKAPGFDLEKRIFQSAVIGRGGYRQPGALRCCSPDKGFEDRQVCLPKPLPKPVQQKQKKAEGDKYVCQNKACRGATGKQLQDEEEPSKLTRMLHRAEPQQPTELGSVHQQVHSPKPAHQEQKQVREEEPNCLSRPRARVTRQQFQAEEQPLQFHPAKQEPPRPQQKDTARGLPPSDSLALLSENERQHAGLFPAAHPEPLQGTGSDVPAPSIAVIVQLAFARETCLYSTAILVLLLLITLSLCFL